MKKAIYQKSNALIAPYVEPWRGGADLSGLPAEVRLHYRGRAIDEWLEPNLSSKVIRKGCYLWGGPFKNHFGHLMVDTLPRLWAWNPDKYDAVIFSPLINEKQPKAWAVELFNRMGIPESQMIFAHEPSLFESVDFPVAGSSLGDGPSDWYLEHLRNNPIFPNDRCADLSPKKIFLGRSHDLNKGTIMGADSYFDSLLRSNGFYSLRPESLLIKDQVNMLQNAEVIVFVEGSAIYSLELAAKARGEIFMLPQRNGTVSLFEPHLSPKAKRFLKIDCGHILRVDNAGGKQRPNCPSFYIEPLKAWNSLAAFELVTGAFDLELYEHHEERDTYSYFFAQTELALDRLVKVREARGRF